MKKLLIVFALLVCGATAFAQPALADTSRMYFHDGKFSWHAPLSTLSTFLASSAAFTEAAQDAVGGILADGNTINFRYQDNVPDISADVITQMSIASDASGLKLSGDATTPGASKLYGTDASGVKGWYDQPGGGGGGSSVATDAIWDAKGDLAVGTGANTASRLAVGTGGMPLYADASTATGVRWGQSVITPTQITSNQNDYSPTGWANCQVAIISGDATIPGITSFAATFTGDKKTIINGGSYPIYIPGEHPSGTAANRVTAKADIVLLPGASVDLIYSGTRWLPSAISDPGTGRSLYYYLTPGSTTAGDNNYGVFTLTGTGASVTNAAAGSGFPSSHQLSTGSTATGSGIVSLVKSNTSFARYTDAHVSVESIVSIPTLSDGTNRYIIDIEMTSSPTTGGSAGSNCVGIRYTDDVNSGKFYGVTRTSGGAETTVDLGVTVAVNTLYVLRTEFNKAANEARFYVNGVLCGTSTTNLPTAVAVGARCQVRKTVGTTGSTLRVHTLWCKAFYP